MGSTTKKAGARNGSLTLSRLNWWLSYFWKARRVRLCMCKLYTTVVIDHVLGNIFGPIASSLGANRSNEAAKKQLYSLPTC